MRITLAIVTAWLIGGTCYGQKISSVINLDKNVTLTSVVEPFRISQHKYDTCVVEVNIKSICLIDGEIWFGGDAGLDPPRSELKRLTLKIRDISVNLDVSGIYNPSFNGTLSKGQFELKTNGDIYTLYGAFSDGAGSYTAHWMIVRGKALRQVISKDERDFYWQQK